MKHIFSRRDLLKRLNFSALALPLWSVLQETGLAQGSEESRALFVYYPDGNILKDFFPDSVGSAFDLPTITAPLAPFKSKLILPKGLHYKTGGSHEGGASYCLTGVADSSSRVRYSIDSYLGDQLASDRPYKSLRLGVGANFQSGDDKRIAFLKTGAGAFVEDHPKKAFTNIFGQGLTADQTNQTVNLDKSVLDFSLNQLKALQQNLGAIEKSKLDSHLQALRELELRIGNAANITCSPTPDYRGIQFPDQETSYPPTHQINDHFGLMSEIMIDIMVEAFHCGVARFGLLQWSHAVSPTRFDFTKGPGIGKHHHELSHYGGDPNGGMAQEFKACQKWYMEQMALLLTKLEARKISERSLLDSMTVMATTEIADSNLHNFENIPCVMAGGANGKLKTGQALNLNGEAFNRLHVTILRAMGLSDSTFGDPDAGSGAIDSMLV